MGNFLLENAHILTGANNTYNIGSNTNKWKAVYATSFIGNASTASKLAAAFTLTLDGAVTGSASIDGSGQVTLSTAVNHTHGTSVAWNNRALTVTAGGTSATASIPATLTGFTSITSTTFVGNLTGTASHVNITDTTPTSATTYYLLYSAGKTGGQAVRANADLYYYDTGSNGYLNIGSSSQAGGLTLHEISSGNFYVDLIADSLTATRTIKLPNQSGTVSLTSHTHATSASWSNRTLSITAGGTSASASIPTTLTGFASISSTTFVGALSGNASTASSWKDARTVTFTGDVSGSFTINGAANVSCSLAVANDSHTHSTSSSWSNRSLTVTAAGTSATSTIPATLTGFTSITSKTLIASTKMVIPVKASDYTSSTAGEIWIVA